MSGRHRQSGPGITRRALAGTIPVLGAAGAATGLVLSTGAAAPQAADAGATTDEAVQPTAAETTPPPPPSVRTAVPGHADQAVSAVSAATDAAREQDALAQAREQHSVNAVVADIRADARQRDAVAQQQGRTELEAFQDQQAQDQQAQPQKAREQEQVQRDGDSSSPPSSNSGTTQPSGPGECDLSGLPRLSPFADSDEIVNRDCGMTDGGGRERSQDPWIDSQLLSDDAGY